MDILLNQIFKKKLYVIYILPSREVVFYVVFSLLLFSIWSAGLIDLLFDSVFYQRPLKNIQALGHFALFSNTINSELDGRWAIKEFVHVVFVVYYVVHVTIFRK